jgi:hypothetical protein
MQVLQDAFDKLNGLGEALRGRIRIQVRPGLVSVAVVCSCKHHMQLPPSHTVY